MEDLVDQMDYVANLVGIEYVGLGADYFELTENFRRSHGMPKSGFLGIPEELDSYDKLANLTRALCRRGYSDSDIRKILGENLLRVFQVVFGE